MFVQCGLSRDHLVLTLFAFDYLNLSFSLDDAGENLILKVFTSLLQSSTKICGGEGRKILL